ncbi:hypothetical protein F2Q69_00048976 [Brassica cretica]|uniref:Uncharacterized protein n=1 Tax=Brassica cretica TaxID=69181 RepID=A0A8S9PW56_BRACR|nr:hypothetical protein F2Q69_00048976 [Brassica cretica]
MGFSRWLPAINGGGELNTVTGRRGYNELRLLVEKVGLIDVLMGGVGGVEKLGRDRSIGDQGRD